MSWLGRKKLALIPLFRPHAIPPDQIPPDWEDRILRRVLFDPDPNTGADRSLRAYIRAASSGRADLDTVVLPRESVDSQNVPVDVLEPKLGAQLRQQGFDCAAIVMLGGVNTGSAAIPFWARFAMVEGVGVWAMEFMHCLTEFLHADTLGSFDEMSCSCATHPSAYTKAGIGWLDPSTIRLHNGAVAAFDYNLYSIGLPQPPPSGRTAAVRIGSTVPYLMIEARQRVDQFEKNIPSEGVIVYKVQTNSTLGGLVPPPLELLTPTALIPGQSFRSPDGISVRVTDQLPGGFRVKITRSVDPDARCPDLLDRIAQVEENLAAETDALMKRRLRQLRDRLKQEARQLGCR